MKYYLTWHIAYIKCVNLKFTIFFRYLCIIYGISRTSSRGNYEETYVYDTFIQSHKV